MHFLTATESLQTPKTGPSRFHMAERSLPTFGPAKTPSAFRPVELARAEPLAGVTGSLFDPGPEPKAAAASVPANSTNDTTAPPFRPTFTHPKSAVPSGSGTVAATPATAASKPRGVRVFKDISWLGGRPGGSREREVQTEWVLDHVTVVRNDLSDSDF